jgi:hypothetical protein
MKLTVERASNTASIVPHANLRRLPRRRVNHASYATRSFWALAAFHGSLSVGAAEDVLHTVNSMLLAQIRDAVTLVVHDVRCEDMVHPRADVVRGKRTTEVLDDRFGGRPRARVEAAHVKEPGRDVQDRRHRTMLAQTSVTHSYP